MSDCSVSYCKLLTLVVFCAESPRIARKSYTVESSRTVVLCTLVVVMLKLSHLLHQRFALVEIHTADSKKNPQDAP